MKLTIGPEILKSYKRLPYKVWYAFAEFIDNSTQAYLNNITILNPVLKAENRILEVLITADNNKITIEDNSIGMTLEEIKKALILGSISNH